VGAIYLATGVTTARDGGNERESFLPCVMPFAGDKGYGPRMLLAGIVDGTSPSSLGVVRVDTPEQAGTGAEIQS